MIKICKYKYCNKEFEDTTKSKQKKYCCHQCAHDNRIGYIKDGEGNITHRKCRDCKEYKPIDQFFQKGDRYLSYCKDCQYLRHSSWKYNMDREVLIELLNEAECFSCGVGSDEAKMCIDHCHETNRVRGLLCYSCNVALGLVNDSVERLENLIRYVKYAGDYSSNGISN